MDKDTAINEGYQPVNIIVGRFQPLTTGHIKCAKQVYEETGVKSVLCMVETLPNKVTAVKPFTSNDLSYMYSNILATGAYPYIEGFMSVKNANIVENAPRLMEIGYCPVSWSCGSDRYAAYSSMAKRYFKEANLVDGFQVIEITRKKHDISSTSVRFFIASDDFESFLQYTPFKVLTRHEARRYFDKLMYEYAKVLNNVKF